MVKQEPSMNDQFITVRPTMIFPMGADHATQGVIDKYHESHAIDLQVGSNAYQTISFGMGIEYTGSLMHYDENGAFGCNYSNYAGNVTTYLGFDLNSLYLTCGNPNTQTTRVVGANEPMSQRTTGFVFGSDGKVALDVSTFEASEEVIGFINNFIQKIDSKRAEFGATQNRIESAISNQENVIENVSDSRSRIRDTDYARSVAQMTQNSILQQASTSILTQANALPNIALTLLQQQ